MPAREVCSLSSKKLGLDDPADQPKTPRSMAREQVNGSRNMPGITEARTSEKREINANTLRDGLATSGFRNMCRNLGEMRDRGGIRHYGRNLSQEFQSVLVLAAGPSLDRVLPRLEGTPGKSALSSRWIPQCRACVRAGVEPDFIVLVDPQYWNWRHLDGAGLSVEYTHHRIGGMACRVPL